MQNIQKIHEADPEKNASLTGWTDKQMDGRKGLILQDSSAKMEV